MIQYKEEPIENTHRILAGYVHRSQYKNEDGTVSDWITMLKGIILYTADNGLYAEDGYVAELINHLCTSRIIFKRPYQPLENYGNSIPLLVIERLQSRHILIDIAKDTRDYNKKIRYAADNPEYECVIFKNGEDIQPLIQKIRKEWPPILRCLK